jgi:hypothetical protein
LGHRSLISLVTPDVITLRETPRAAAAMVEHVRMSRQQAGRRGVARARPGGGRGARAGCR